LTHPKKTTKLLMSAGCSSNTKATNRFKKHPEK
jgi:hypothetical protein